MKKFEKAELKNKMPPLSFFLCTRDRPEIVMRCITSLKDALHPLHISPPANLFVFDDSTTVETSALLKRICRADESESLQIVVIDRQIQNGILERLISGRRDLAQFLGSICKPFGSGKWDLAGVRNFAFLFAFVISKRDDELLVFLDDDMIFSNTTYQGHSIPVNGADVLWQLDDAILNGQKLAAGTGYRGRRDMSVLEHLTSVCDEIETELRLKGQGKELVQIKKLESFPSSLPIQLSLPGDDFDIGLGPAGISGAVLAVRVPSLLSHYLMRCYNEDWIWLTLLGEPQKEIVRVKDYIVHAAPPQTSITNEFVIYQEKGEIIFKAIMNAVTNMPQGQDRANWCEDHLLIEQIEQAKCNQINEAAACLQKIRNIETLFCDYSYTDATKIIYDIHNALAIVEVTIREITNLSSHEILKEIIEYLQSKSTWYELLNYAKNTLATETSNVQHIQEGA